MPRCVPSTQVTHSYVSVLATKEASQSRQSRVTVIRVYRRRNTPAAPEQAVGEGQFCQLNAGR
jgi:hypothetical protein|eukprot:COSAG01_NODE_9243_length_2507_cov_4.230482_4_plen_63_part_00